MSIVKGHHHLELNFGVFQAFSGVIKQSLLNLAHPKTLAPLISLPSPKPGAREFSREVWKKNKKAEMDGLAGAGKGTGLKDQHVSVVHLVFSLSFHFSLT
jgi:hypothetical protein